MWSCSASWPPTAKAQTSGEITGLVTDSSGAVVSGASVVVTNKATEATRKATTNEEGLYAFPSLPPGLYELTVERAGFKDAHIDNIRLEVQQAARLDVTMEVGQVGETVTIDSTAVLLNTENATIGTVIENKIVTELPLNGRQYLNLVALSPNANVLAPAAGQAGARQGGDRAQQSISAGGQRIMFDYFTLDGVNNTDPNFNTYVVLPSIDAIQEFKVQTGVYPAEFGHQSDADQRADQVRRQRLSRRAVRISSATTNWTPCRTPFTTSHQAKIALQMERLRLRARRAGAHSQAVQRAEQAVLHGQL